MLRNLLIYRIIIVNLLGVALLAFAWHKGWITALIEGDSTGISYVIAALFAVGMLSVFWRARKVSAILNITKAPGGFSPRAINRAKFTARQSHIAAIASWLGLLGLIGTVVGIGIALNDVDPDAMSTAADMKRVIGTLIQGIRVALYTTIVGSVLGLWLGINYQILRTATVSALEDIRGRTA